MHAAVMLLALLPTQPPPKDELVVKPDAFQTLVNPNCSHCVDEAKRRRQELRDDDRVLAWTRGKYDGGAIPIRFFLNPYRVVSDTYGTFVYDPDAGYARGFPASLEYRFHGWRHGVMVMRHKDGTLFSCLSGRAFDGPRKGEKLPYWPTVVTDWGWYLKNYPGGVAYHMYEKYQPVELSAKANADSLRTRPKPDPRLPAEEMVLGIVHSDPSHPKDEEALAVRLAVLEKMGRHAVLNYDEGLSPVAVVLWQASTRTAAAYQQIAEKREPTTELGVEGPVVKSSGPLQLVADGKSADAPFFDRKTGSRFDITGRCVEGDLKGWTLQPIESVMCKWFAWAAEYPKTHLIKK